MCIQLFLQSLLYTVMMSSVVLVTSSIKLFVCKELKHLLMKLKEENEKVGLKLNIQKTKIMAGGETMETVIDFILGSSKNHCRLWPQPWNWKTLAPWKKSYDQELDNILKNRDITLSTKVCLVKSMVFPMVMYECESWTIKKAEHQRIDAFEL